MKKILVLFSFIILFLGCSPEDSNVRSHLEVLPVTSVVMPETFVINQISDISVSFVLPTTCHIFRGFFYEADLNTRTVAVQSMVVEEGNCVPAGGPVTQILKFKPTQHGTYTFKFWKGKDQNGEDVFEIREVPVEE